MKDNKIVVPLYYYEDEDSGEKVYDFESILDEVRKVFTETTGKDWEGE